MIYQHFVAFAYNLNNIETARRRGKIVYGKIHLCGAHYLSALIQIDCFGGNFKKKIFSVLNLDENDKAFVARNYIYFTADRGIVSV